MIEVFDPQGNLTDRGKEAIETTNAFIDLLFYNLVNRGFKPDDVLTIADLLVKQYCDKYSNTTDWQKG